MHIRNGALALAVTAALSAQAFVDFEAVQRQAR